MSFWQKKFQKKSLCQRTPSRTKAYFFVIKFSKTKGFLRRENISAKLFVWQPEFNPTPSQFKNAEQTLNKSSFKHFLDKSDLRTFFF